MEETKPDQAEFIDICSLMQILHLILHLEELERAVTVFLRFFSETWTKRWPSVSELEMLDVPWFNVEKGIQRFRLKY